MRTIETNDWVILNDIIYDIYTTEDFSAMRFHFLEHMQMLLDFDAAVFSLPSPKVPEVLDSCTTLHCDPDTIRKYHSLDYRHGIMYGGKSMVFRDTDIISEEKRTQSEYYRSVYIPNKWSYALQMTLARSGNFLGAVTLYRTVGKPDFAYFDIFIITRPENLENIKSILDDIHCGGMTLSTAMGCGTQKGIAEDDAVHELKGFKTKINLLPKIKIEVVVDDKDVEEIIAAVREKCATGRVGDGKIFIRNMEDAVRIRTGGRGIKALAD